MLHATEYNREVQSTDQKALFGKTVQDTGYRYGGYCAAGKATEYRVQPIIADLQISKSPIDPTKKIWRGSIIR